MKPTKENTMNANTKIVLTCDESACEKYQRGHEEYAATTEPEDILHEREAIEGDGYRVVTMRGGWEKNWRVEIEVYTNDPYFTPEEARTFTAAITKAAYDCEALNALVNAVSAATPMRLVIPAQNQNASYAWGDDAFHLVITQRPHTHPVEGEHYSAFGIMHDWNPAHPVHTAKQGDTWQFGTGEDMTPVYEYVGKFTVVDKLLDKATEDITYVIERVGV